MDTAEQGRFGPFKQNRGSSAEVSQKGLVSAGLAVGKGMLMRDPARGVPASGRWAIVRT